MIVERVKGVLAFLFDRGSFHERLPLATTYKKKTASLCERCSFKTPTIQGQLTFKLAVARRPFGPITHLIFIYLLFFIMKQTFQQTTLEAEIGHEFKLPFRRQVMGRLLVRRQ